MVRLILSVGASLLLTLLTAGCATFGAGGDSGDAKPVRVQYTLKPQEPIPYNPPLPTLTEIPVAWEMSDGTTQTVPGYRAWDFTGEGRYQMVEALKDDGTVAAYVFDFDGDGKVDATVKPESK